MWSIGTPPPSNMGLRGNNPAIADSEKKRPGPRRDPCLFVLLPLREKIKPAFAASLERWGPRSAPLGGMCVEQELRGEPPVWPPAAGPSSAKQYGGLLPGLIPCGPARGTSQVATTREILPSARRDSAT